MTTDNRDAEASLALRLAKLAERRQSEFILGLALAEVIERHSPERPQAAADSDALDALNLSPADSVASLLTGLRDLGFGQPLSRPPNLLHSHLPHVIAAREGIPIALALIVIEVARRWGLQACGLNHPGHFLALVESEIVDPATLRILHPDELQPQPSSLANLTATPRMIGLRMLNNLKALFMAGGDAASCLEMVDLQLAMTGQELALAATLHYERGEYWQRLGAAGAARDAYLKCAELSGDSELAQQAQSLADRLQQAGSSETLH